MKQALLEKPREDGNKLFQCFLKPNSNFQGMAENVIISFDHQNRPILNYPIFKQFTNGSLN